MGIMLARDAYVDHVIRYHPDSVFGPHPHVITTIPGSLLHTLATSTDYSSTFDPFYSLGHRGLQRYINLETGRLEGLIDDLNCIALREVLELHGVDRKTVSDYISIVEAESQPPVDDNRLQLKRKRPLENLVIHEDIPNRPSAMRYEGGDLGIDPRTSIPEGDLESRKQHLCVIRKLVRHLTQLRAKKR